MGISFSQIVNGSFSETQILAYIFIHFAFVVSFLYISYRVFISQNKYSIMTHTISFLGSWIEKRNPKGWKIFTLGMIITGLMFIPLFAYIFSHTLLIFEWGAYIGLIFGIVASIGLMLIGIVPDNENLEMYKGISWGKAHDTIAVISVVSFAITILWSGIMILVNNFSQKIEIHASIHLGYVITILVISVGVYYQIRWAKMCKKDHTLDSFPGEGIHSFPLWEWILFGLLLLMTYWIALAL